MASEGAIGFWLMTGSRRADTRRLMPHLEAALESDDAEATCRELFVRPGHIEGGIGLN